MGATYVVVDNLEDALTYHKAGMLHWWSAPVSRWKPQNEVFVDRPPDQSEVTEGWWSILVEDEEV